MQALINLRRQAEVTERMSYSDIQVDEFSPDDIRKMMNTRKMLGTGCYGSVSFHLFLELVSRSRCVGSLLNLRCGARITLLSLTSISWLRLRRYFREPI